MQPPSVETLTEPVPVQNLAFTLKVARRGTERAMA